MPSIVACSLKKEKCPVISLLVISGVAQINHTLCERGKMNKKANAVDAVAVAATNADERAIHRACISRRFAVGFLLNTAFLSYAFSFASSICDTRLLPGYSFPRTFTPNVLYVKSQLNSVAVTVKLGIWNYWRARLFVPPIYLFRFAKSWI